MIRFLFHGGTREKNADSSIRNIGIAHNSAFYFAARNVAKDYKDAEKRAIKITTAADMVKKINACSPKSVTSLDVFCHGTPYSLNFSIKENENCGLVTGWMAKQGLRAYYFTWDDGIYNFSSDSRYVSDIDFKVFTEDARIQIHGCNTARGSMPGNTLVEEFSEQIYNAGRKKAYVIGHTDKSNPISMEQRLRLSSKIIAMVNALFITMAYCSKQRKKKGIIAHDEIHGLIK